MVVVGEIRTAAFCSSLPLKRQRPQAKSASNACCTAKCNISRREAIPWLASLSILPLVQPAAAALDYPELRGLAERNDRMPVFRTENGLRMQELADGSGEAKVEDGSVVSLKYVLRRSNGYFIDASYGFDRFDTFTFRVGSGQVVDGFEAGVRGMREGGRRRFIVPPEMGYVKGTRGAGPIPPDFGAKRSLASHAKEPLIFEVEVVKVR